MLVASDCDRFIVNSHRLKKLFSVVKLLILMKTQPNWGVCKTQNTQEHPRNTPEHPGTPRNSPEQPRNTPGTSHNNPEHPRNSQKHPRTPKIVVSGQTAHELTKPKTSEDSQFFIGLLRINLRFLSISRMLRNIFEAFKNSERNNI